MTSKKKLTIAISSAVVAILLVVGIVFGVLAATSVTVTSNVNVSYTSLEVAAKVSASYKRKTDSTATAMGTQATFDGEEETASATLNPEGTIELTKDNNYVDFIFTFEENGGSHAYEAKLNLTSSASTNVSIYTVSGDTETAFENNASTVRVTSSSTAQTFTIRVKLDEAKKDASFVAAFAWTLTQVQTQA